MKESALVIEKAEEFVIKVEDKWVLDQWQTVEQLEKRARGSNTLVAWNEYLSAQKRLALELERLEPNERNNTK